MGLPPEVIFICINREIMGNNLENWDCSNRGKLSPFIRVWDEYSPNQGL